MVADTSPRPSGGEHRAGTAAARPHRRGGRVHGLTFVVLAVGLVATGLLAFGARESYLHNEKRLTTLQAKLVALLAGSAPVELQGRLDEIAAVTAQAANPSATFSRAIRSSLRPEGPFASAALVLVHAGKPTMLVTAGAAPLRNPDSPAAVALFDQAARSRSLVTTRVARGGIQRLGYLVSAAGPRGVYVVAAGQSLEAPQHLTVPAGSPGADLQFAVYFGRTTAPSALIETNAGHLPISGTTSTSTIPFGSAVLTLVVSPRGSLEGPLGEYLPFGILAVGILLSIGAASMTEWLLRRRSTAESIARENRQLYQEQRDVATALQLAVLPKDLPTIAGVELAARYLPGAKGVEIGGDWYTVVATDENRLVFVMGDVSGHGLAAVSRMASLRYSTRALARLGFGVGEILERANGEFDVGEDDQFATALVGVVDVKRSELTLASAGHLAPLLRRGDSCRFVEVPVGPPLGIAEEGFASVTVPFERGDILLAYTDGLVERRGDDIEASLAKLAAVVATGPSSVEGLVLAVLREMANPDGEDDVALLAIRLP